MNKNNKNIKIIQVNKGNSKFYNRIPQIKQIIEIQKPQLIIIN